MTLFRVLALHERRQLLDVWLRCLAGEGCSRGRRRRRHAGCLFCAEPPGAARALLRYMSPPAAPALLDGARAFREQACLGRRRLTLLRPMQRHYSR